MNCIEDEDVSIYAFVLFFIDKNYMHFLCARGR